MLIFVLRRILTAVPSLVGLLVIAFLLIHIVPADPAAALAGDGATPQQLEEIRRQYGFDQPLYIQFVRYVVDIAHLDFGKSLYSGREVAEDIAERFPATLELTLAALLLAASVGIPLGVVAALNHNRLVDYVLRVASVAGVAIATFWLAIMLQLVFAMWLGWLPLRGELTVGVVAPAGPTGLLLVDALIHGRFSLFLDGLAHIALPAVTLSMGSLATIIRFTRAGVLETLQKDFVTYERAVGYSGARLVWVYVLRNSVIATVTQIGLLFGTLLAGSVVVESIFDWPGIGNYTVQAILAADFKVMLAITLLIGVIYSIVNILTDVVHGLIDPRLWDAR